MAVPLHQLAAARVDAPPAVAATRLAAAPRAAVTAATAAALHRLAPRLRAWTGAARALPVVDGRRVEDGLGVVELSWTGDEAATVWPSLVARILVLPDGPGRSRLVLFSDRAPTGGVAPGGTDPLTSARVLRAAAQVVLEELGTVAIGAATRAQPPAVASPHVHPGLFLHQRRPLDGSAATLAARLCGDQRRLAEAATAAALEAAAPHLAAGRFRRPATPTVSTPPVPPGAAAVARLGWAADEESTGWPALVHELVVEVDPAGAPHLLLLSTHEPGYDLSRNRVDKQQRDRLLRVTATAVADLLAAAIGDARPGSELDTVAAPSPAAVIGVG